ncbi:beta-propeller domain-containing protein, partial [Candidatus Peregrinibacteria bacterium]|nr:beta-propeller domain-containing protein [Candidatus Peregrinibacteria bacterium]
MYKKIVVALLMAVVVLQGAVFAKVATSINSSDKIFTDVDSSSGNFNAIQYLKDQKVVKGYDDGSYKPQGKINRAEFLKIVMEAAGKKPEGKNCYGDVRDAWYSGYICAATKLGLVKGYNIDEFKPEQQISFVEAAKIIVNTLGVDVPDVGPQTDDPSSNWYKKYVAALEAQNAIPKDMATFGYDVTRGQMAEMVWRVKAKPGYVQAIGYDTLERRTKAAASGGALETFSSCVDLKNYLVENSKQGYHGPMMLEDAVMSVPSPMKSAAPDDTGSVAGSADYSTTNLQVQGVDEADIVKNDGKYVYVLKGNTVRVVQATPPSGMKELDRVKFDDEKFTPEDMYVDGNRLVVIGSAYSSLYDRPYVNEKVGMMPIIGDNFYYGGVTKMYIFDISDHAKITKLRALSYEGNYTSSRKIGNMVYMIMNKPEFTYKLPEGWTEHEIVPLYEDSRTGKADVATSCNKIMYLPGSDSTNYIVVAGVPVDNADAKTVDEVVVGSSGNVFASTKNLYVAEEKYSWFYYNSEDNKEQTTVHKFSLSSEAIKYFGKADVPGHIINQFSMDEFGDNFRIATTIGHAWNTDKSSKSGVYVLDANLKSLGKVDGIAPGEEIYSTRFAGDKLYMVTFKKVDPFFVISLADPSNPKILGKLKIPGFSDYLEPYDENHIIG